MATFVIIHGAWGGGWEWSHVADILRGQGHRVFTPTLTGMGERAHLSRGEPVGLGTHVEDVVAVLELEDLREVVLCGASYGGLAATGAAGRAAERVRLLVYIDGLVPIDGQPPIDTFPEAFAASVREGVTLNGPAWRVPIPDGLFDDLLPAASVPEPIRASYRERIRDHPAATFIEPVHLSAAAESIPRAYVRCTAAEYAERMGGDPVAIAAERARAAGWTYREIAVGHDPQVFDPEGIARLLMDLGA